MTSLLPSGFVDLYGDSAEKHYDIESSLLNFFRGSGYRLYLPSLFDFDQPEPNDNYFKVVDPVDNNTLKIRSDITKQVSRLFKQKKIAVEKFCYKGDIYFRKSLSGDFSRKYTQIGVENIRAKGQDLEVLKLLFSALESLNIDNFTISISLPMLLSKYCAAKNISIEQSLELAKSLENGDLGKFEHINFSDIKEHFLAKSIKEVKINSENQEVKNCLSEFNTIISALHKLVRSNNIVVDLFKSNNSDYHTDFSFEIYSNKFKNIIARGGAYNIEHNMSALGFSLYVEELSKLI